MPARGALIARADHPEWRQLIIQAALRRADELGQLHQLPGKTLPIEITERDQAKTGNTPTAVAGVPLSRDDAEPVDVTGTIPQFPDAAIPVDIGETSSFELPVIPQEEQPPVIRTPQRIRPQHESLNVEPEPKPASPPPERRKRMVHHTHRARVAAKPPQPLQFNLFEALFASFNIDPRTGKPRRRQIYAPSTVR